MRNLFKGQWPKTSSTPDEEKLTDAQYLKEQLKAIVVDKWPDEPVKDSSPKRKVASCEDCRYSVDNALYKERTDEVYSSPDNIKCAFIGSAGQGAWLHFKYTERKGWCGQFDPKTRECRYCRYWGTTTLYDSCTRTKPNHYCNGFVARMPTDE